MNVKLKYIQEDINNRRLVANYYLNNLKNKKIILPTFLYEDGHVWHLFVIRIKNREIFQKYLHDKGIQTLIHYPIPIHQQQVYNDYKHLKLPITELIHNEIISLPLSAVLSLADVRTVVRAINNFLMNQIVKLILLQFFKFILRFFFNFLYCR